MKIHKIEIIGYGKWRNQIFEFSEGLQVIQGENESGKSTIRAFMEHVLFGFPKKKQGQYLFAPITGEAMGGRIWISDTIKGDVVVERIVRDGKVYCAGTLSDGTVLDEAGIQELFFHVSMRQYDQIFGFNEEQLQQFQFQSPEEMDRYLYSVSVTGSDAWVELASNFQKQADKQFTPKASKRDLNRQLQKLQQLSHELQERAKKNGVYEQLQGQQQTLFQQQKETELELEQCRMQLQTVHQLEELWDLYEAYRQQQEEKTETWNEKWTIHMRELQAEKKWTTDALHTQLEAEAQWKQEEAHQESLLQWQESQSLVQYVMQHQEELQQQVQQYEQQSRQLTQLQEEIQMEYAFWQVNPHQLPPALSEQERSWLKNIADELQTLERYLQRLQQQQEELQERTRNLEEKQLEVPVSQSEWNQRMLWGGVVAVLLLAGLLIPIGMLKVGAFVVAFGIVWMKKEQLLSSSKGNDSLQQYLQEEIARLRLEEDKISHELSTGKARREFLIEQRKKWWNQSAYKETTITLELLMEGDPLRNVRQLLQEGTQVTQQLQILEQQLEQHARQWSWYFDNGLAIRPQTVSEEWSVIQQAVQSLQNQAQFQQRKYQTLAAIQEKIVQLQQAVAQTEEKIRSLYEQANVSSQEQFDQQARQYEQSRQQQQVRQEREQVLQEYLPLFENYPQLEDLQATLQKEEAKEKHLQQQYREILATIAKVEQEMHVLEADGTNEEMMMQFEIEKEEALQQLKKWASQQYAAMWIFDSLQRQLPAGQEKMMEQASHYLKRLTMGRYPQLQFVEGQLQVTRFDHRHFSIAQLSKGTMDLVLIAIRFAFLTTLVEKMPIFMMVDDGFVHIDSNRKQILLELLQEIAQKTQVFYFTMETPRMVSSTQIITLAQPERRMDDDKKII